MEELMQLLQHIVDAFPDDPSMPSVTMSVVDGQYYVSVLRYAQKFGQGKFVVCSCRGADLHACVQHMLKETTDGYISRRAVQRDAEGDHPVQAVADVG